LRALDRAATVNCTEVFCSLLLSTQLQKKTTRDSLIPTLMTTTNTVPVSDIVGFRTLSIVLVIKNTAKIVKNSKNTTFRKLDLFPSSGEGKPTLLGPLERASLSPVSETSCFLLFFTIFYCVFNKKDDGYSPKT
jgi:hypothetical protein